MIYYLKKTIEDHDIKTLENFESDCWINVVNPTHKEIGLLVAEFNLDKNNLLSGIDPHEIPRVDFINEDIYTYIKTPYRNSKIGTFTLLIVMTKKFILTLSKEDVLSYENISAGEMKNLSVEQKSKFFIAILNMNNAIFKIKTLDIVKSIETRNIKALKEKDIDEMISHEYILNNFVSSYSYMNFMYNKIIHRLGLLKQDKDILKELMIDAEEGGNICETSLKNISNIRNYNMILLTYRLNRLITTLTVVTVFLSVVAAISSIYGMNIRLPLQDDGNAFLFVIFLITISWIIFIIYLRKKKVI
ncbi:MAG: CorA family divalent cation transporter [Patescibacteria group bacterium]